VLSIETIAAIASVGTLFVLGAGAIAAVVQLRHVRNSYQLDALLSLQKDFKSSEIQTALCYVQEELPEKLSEKSYRDELEVLGFINMTKHPELVVCNWFNEIGTLIKNDLVSTHLFMELFGKLVVYYWKILTPVIAIVRRNRGDWQYHDFEYLAIHAAAWLKAYPRGRFDPRLKRDRLHDPFAELDQTPITATQCE